MSVHEDALHALAEDLACGDPWELHLEAAERIKVFLAALPPSIVVDGQVVELAAVVAEYTRDTANRGLWNSSLEIGKYREAIVDSWLKAAREVARGEGR